MSKTEINATNPNRLDFQGSSNLISATFDPTSRIVEVEFKNGSKYRYQNFTPQKMGAWVTAPSAGKWFEDNVKKGKDHPLAESGQASTTAPAPADAAGETAPAPADAPPGTPPKNDQPATDNLPSTPGPSDLSPELMGKPRDPSENSTQPTLRTDHRKVDNETRVRARSAYEAYAENSNGLTFDGRTMPTWENLNHAVKSHWCAAAAAISTSFTSKIDEADKRVEAAQRELAVKDGELVRATEKIAKAPGQREHDRLSSQIAELQANPAVARAAMLDAEIDQLRAEKAVLERDLREANLKLTARE